MAADPYDNMLLTERPTTVVTQATRLHDTMPDPHGSSQDEEALFSGIGADPASTPSAQDPGSPLASAAAKGVLTGDDATGEATVRSGAGAAQAVYNALMQMPADQRSAWAANRPRTAAAVNAHAKAVGLPAPTSALGGIGIGIMGLVVLGVVGYMLLGRRAA